MSEDASIYAVLAAHVPPLKFDRIQFTIAVSDTEIGVNVSIYKEVSRVFETPEGPIRTNCSVDCTTPKVLETPDGPICANCTVYNTVSDIMDSVSHIRSPSSSFLEHWVHWGFSKPLITGLKHNGRELEASESLEQFRGMRTVRLEDISITTDVHKVATTSMGHN